MLLSLALNVFIRFLNYAALYKFQVGLTPKVVTCL